jgi:hypothetical protein
MVAAHAYNLRAANMAEAFSKNFRSVILFNFLKLSGVGELIFSVQPEALMGYEHSFRSSRFPSQLYDNWAIFWHGSACRYIFLELITGEELVKYVVCSKNPV